MKLEQFFFKELHESTKRNPIERVTPDKPYCMKIAKEFGFDFWDGDRKYGYGGYRYIPGRFSFIAKKFIDVYSLSNRSKILDVGCGKGFLLYEIKKILPEIEVHGFDISEYAIKNIHPDLKGEFLVHDASKKFPYDANFFDLTISAATLHNLRLDGIGNALCEIERVSKSSYVMVEGYRNENELFNLECWALTAESFFHHDEWIWIFDKFGYSGDYEFIYF
jgi:SAM-dependent methyltransferase